MAKEKSLFGGSKYRYCRLIGTIGTALGPNATSFEKVSLVILHKQTDPVEKGRELDVGGVTEVKLDSKGRGHLTIMTGARSVRMTANPPEDAKTWSEELTRHAQALRDSAAKRPKPISAQRPWLQGADL